jgi:hypothetical protein
MPDVLVDMLKSMIQKETEESISLLISNIPKENVSELELRKFFA